jgi:hypothetical protein
MYGRPACSAIDGESIGPLLNPAQTILPADRQTVLQYLPRAEQTISLNLASTFNRHDNKTLKSISSQARNQSTSFLIRSCRANSFLQIL